MLSLFYLYIPIELALSQSTLPIIGYGLGPLNASNILRLAAEVLRVLIIINKVLINVLNKRIQLEKPGKKCFL